MKKLTFLILLYSVSFFSLNAQTFHADHQVILQKALNAKLFQQEFSNKNQVQYPPIQFITHSHCSNQLELYHEGNPVFLSKIATSKENYTSLVSG